MLDLFIYYVRCWWHTMTSQLVPFVHVQAFFQRWRMHRAYKRIPEELRIACFEKGYIGRVWLGAKLINSEETEIPTEEV